MLQEKTAPISILTYKSHKMARAASATMAVEANALSEALAEVEWSASWFGFARDIDYDPRRRDVLNRDFQACSIITQDDSSLDVASIIDAKSLYDNLAREQYSGAERRSALEVCVIRDSLNSLNGRARWVPHEENPVDCLTKMRGNSARLLQLTQDHSFCLVGASTTLEQRKEFREQTGRRNPRPNCTSLKG